MKFWLLVIIFLILLVVAPFVGALDIRPASILGNELFSQVFWELRVPRVLIAVIVGAVLTVSGLVFHALFRNVLACPFTLGVSSGASLGAALFFKFGLGFIAGPTLFAFSGALITILLITAVSRISYSSDGILLSGIICSFFFSSLVLLVQYLSDVNEVFKLNRWLMGGLDVVGMQSIYTLLCTAVPGIAAVFIHRRDLDLLSFGDEIAESRGVDAARVRRKLLFFTALMVGGVVSTCGPIGFIGIIVPQIARAMFGLKHEDLFLSSLLLGASFLLLCDTMARTLFLPNEIPVGVITALFGGPFFLWILLKRS